MQTMTKIKTKDHETHQRWSHECDGEYLVHLPMHVRQCQCGETLGHEVRLRVVRQKRVANA